MNEYDRNHSYLPESGNMIIMGLDYTQRTGDTSLVTTYVSEEPQQLIVAHVCA